MRFFKKEKKKGTSSEARSAGSEGSQGSEGERMQVARGKATTSEQKVMNEKWPGFCSLLRP